MNITLESGDKYDGEVKSEILKIPHGYGKLTFVVRFHMY